jgi:lipopolysaccharide/colanic/teichoic acid biosynthesis glycosyltransferase
VPAKPYRSQRFLDLIVLVLVSLPALVVGLGCGLLVKLTSRGPVLYRQERVGMGTERFEVLKFRTMVDAPDNSLFPDADRITPVGRVLRRFSLDELPQLVNVARHEMSIVGPRPTLPYQLELFDERQSRRFSVRPGLTGLAQTRGRNRISWGERLDSDVEYVERQSLLLDLHILVRTPLVVFGGAGVEGHPHDDPLVADDAGGSSPRPPGGSGGSAGDEVLGSGMVADQR